MSISISWIGKKQTGEAAVSRAFNHDPYFSLYENYVVLTSAIPVHLPTEISTRFNLPSADHMMIGDV